MAPGLSIAAMSHDDTSEQLPIKPQYPSAKERERLFFPFSKKQRNGNAWIVVHKGAFHICNDRNAFTTYESTVPFEIRIVSNDNSSEDDLGLYNKYIACGIGELRLGYRTLDGTPEERLLQDVLHVPEAFANFASLPRMLKATTPYYKLDAKRGVAFSVVDDRDLAWFPPDCQGLPCLALDGETPYFPGPSSLFRRGPIRSLSVESIGRPLPNKIDTLDKLSFIFKLKKGLDPKDEHNNRFYDIQKTELNVSQILALLGSQYQRAQQSRDIAILSCRKERCFHSGAFVLRFKGEFAVCKERERFTNLTPIPPQPAASGEAEVIGVGDLQLPIILSSGSRGKLFLASVSYSPKALINSIPYSILFGPGMACAGGSYDPTTGVAANKDGVEVAWFTTCHDETMPCLVQPDVRLPERRLAIPFKLLGPENPPELALSQAKPVREKQKDSTSESSAGGASKDQNEKVSFLAPDGSVGQIGAPQKRHFTFRAPSIRVGDPLPFPRAGEKMSQAGYPGYNADTRHFDQPASLPRDRIIPASHPKEATGADISSRPTLEKTNAEAQSVNPHSSPLEPAEDFPAATGKREFYNRANSVLDGLVAELAERNPSWDLSHLQASPGPPTSPLCDAPFSPIIQQAISDFNKFSHRFACCAAGGTLTEKQTRAYVDAVARMALLCSDGPAVIAKLAPIESDDDTLTTTSSCYAPPSMSPGTETPPPAGEKLHFHESARALIERVRLHGRAARKAIGKAAADGDQRALQLMFVIGHVAGLKMLKSVNFHERRAMKRKNGDMSAAVADCDTPDVSDYEDDYESGVDDDCVPADAFDETRDEEEEREAKTQKALEDIAHERLGYPVDFLWDRLGAVEEKAMREHAVKIEEEGPFVVTRVADVEGEAAAAKATQSKALEEESDSDDSLIKDIIQATSQEPSVAVALNTTFTDLKECLEKCSAMAEHGKSLEKEREVLELELAVMRGQDDITGQKTHEIERGMEESAIHRDAAAEEEPAVDDESRQQILAALLELQRQRNATRGEENNKKKKAALDIQDGCKLFDFTARWLEEQQSMAALMLDADDAKKEVERHESEDAADEKQQSVTNFAVGAPFANNKTPMTGTTAGQSAIFGLPSTTFSQLVAVETDTTAPVGKENGSALESAFGMHEGDGRRASF